MNLIYDTVNKAKGQAPMSLRQSSYIERGSSTHCSLDQETHRKAEEVPNDPRKQRLSNGGRFRRTLVKDESILGTPEPIGGSNGHIPQIWVPARSLARDHSSD